MKRTETDCNEGFSKLVSLTVVQGSFLLFVTFDYGSSRNKYFIPSFVLKLSWFFFEIIVKSMAQTLVQSDKLTVRKLL